MNILLTIVGVIFAILQIILFFKLWGMTNDVREMKNRYLRSSSLPEPDNNAEGDPEVSLYGKLVVDLATGKQMRAKSITTEGKYKCYAGGVHLGDFDRSEIMDFNLWVKNKEKY